MAKVFVDDVFLLAKTVPNMQLLLTLSESRPKEVQNEWSIKKSFGIQLHGLVTIRCQELQDRDEEVYLCVSLGRYGVAESKRLERLQVVLSVLRLLRYVTRHWELPLRQRRRFVKTFVYRNCDYLLYLQPVTEQIRKTAANLD